MSHFRKRAYLIVAVLLCIVALFLVRDRPWLPGGASLSQRWRGEATVADRLAQYGPAARERWRPYFERHGMAYPPQKLVLLGLKRERQMEIHAANAGQPLKPIRSVSIQKLSGQLGPKLRYGDYQVPEGIYGIEYLNPNSRFHLSLRVDYPNAADRAQARLDKRTRLGGDIMIHGSNVSVGCLAMGDEVAEDLFILAADTGKRNIKVILSPLDFRTNDLPPDPRRPAWVRKRYGEIKAALSKLPAR